MLFASTVCVAAPTAALFFLTYETSKSFLAPLFHAPAPLSSSAAAAAAATGPDAPVNPLVHIMSASAGEVVACLVRVPTENVKQKVQAGQYRTSFECFKALALINTKPIASVAAAPIGGTSPAVPAVAPSALRNFYRGFGTTIMRDLPFAFIQFPLYEYGKASVARFLASRHAAAGGSASDAAAPALQGWQCACVGSMAGGIAAALTTPLDVAKTRLMLQQAHPAAAAAASSPAAATAATVSLPRGFLGTFRSLYAEGGIPLLFSGVVPRVMWISIGGFVFFGAYEGVKKRLDNKWGSTEDSDRR